MELRRFQPCLFVIPNLIPYHAGETRSRRLYLKTAYQKTPLTNDMWRTRRSNPELCYLVTGWIAKSSSTTLIALYISTKQPKLPN